MGSFNYLGYFGEMIWGNIYPYISLHITYRHFFWNGLTPICQLSLVYDGLASDQGLNIWFHNSDWDSVPW